ncbi:hypothetical protein HF521_014187 [Silurus meridionalis]|uniref:Uncharacterized protein n=1 Tax=Silurus meridionalis TaxID=175797 RepID=A0A8T0AA63_SILME|nr:hypothetical protein HF521_014187 [Silurus meridionalis]
MGDGPNPAQLCTEKVQAEDVVPGSRTEIITIPTALLESQTFVFQKSLQCAGDGSLHQHFNLIRSTRLRGTTTSRVHPHPAQVPAVEEKPAAAQVPAVEEKPAQLHQHFNLIRSTRLRGTTTSRVHPHPAQVPAVEEKPAAAQVPAVEEKPAAAQVPAVEEKPAQV